MLDIKFFTSLDTNKEFYKMKNNISEVHSRLFLKEDYKDFKGWLDIEKLSSEKLLEDIKESALNIREKADALLVLGIGGSYLGAKTIIDALQGDDFEIYFAGNNISERYIKNVLASLKDKKYAINLISKSGSTIETNIAYQIFKKDLEKKCTEHELKELIYVTCGESDKNPLREYAEKESYRHYFIPENIGGRYSVFTPVGLLPCACKNINIEKLLEGAGEAYRDLSKNSLDNKALQYAAARTLFYEKGKILEFFLAYEEDLRSLNEWLKQLFAESECKGGKGIVPSSLILSTDLHSLGQMLQDGEKIFFETHLHFKASKKELFVSSFLKNNNGNTTKLFLSDINDTVLYSTISAHKEGGSENILIDNDELSEKSLGYFMYFMMCACALSCLMRKVNPFDQPGVEIYKSYIKNKLS